MTLPGQPAVSIQLEPIMQNRPAEMDMDIIIAATPDTVALEQEVFESVMDLIRSGIDPMSPVFEIVLELAPLPDKTRLIERIQGMRQQVQEQQAQAQQAQAQQEQEDRQLQLAEQAAGVEKTQAETEGKQIDNEIKVQQATGIAQP